MITLPPLIAHVILPPLSKIGMKTESYTSWNIILFIWCILSDTKDLIPYIFVSFNAINISFHIVYFLDNTVFIRFAKDLNVSICMFKFIDVIAHISTPFISYLYIRFYKIQLLWYHGLLTSIFHISWAFRINGSLLLDNIYIKLKPHYWYISWSIAIFTEIMFPFFQFFISFYPIWADIFMCFYCSIMITWILCLKIQDIDNDSNKLINTYG